MIISALESPYYSSLAGIYHQIFSCPLLHSTVNCMIQYSLVTVLASRGLMLLEVSSVLKQLVNLLGELLW